MKLTDIENPLVMDSSKPTHVQTSKGRGKVVGFTPEIKYPNFTSKASWAVLIDGDKPGYEYYFYDAEIIKE